MKKTLEQIIEIVSERAIEVIEDSLYEMKGKYAYLAAMKIAPISLDSELAPNKSDDRDWSRVEVKKRMVNKTKHKENLSAD